MIDKRTDFLQKLTDLILAARASGPYGTEKKAVISAYDAATGIKPDCGCIRGTKECKFHPDPVAEYDMDAIWDAMRVLHDFVEDHADAGDPVARAVLEIQSVKKAYGPKMREMTNEIMAAVESIIKRPAPRTGAK